MGLQSQNGWAVLTATQLTWFTAAGQQFAAANADVATVAKHFIERFAAEVEPITGAGIRDDWSFAARFVRGSTTQISNHSSATAWDLNALKHPRGARNTFTTRKATRMRKICREITDAAGKPVLRLGMDFTTTVDDMHIEVTGDRHSIHQAALKIRKLQEDEVKPEDIKAIAREVRDLLVTDGLVPNQKLDPADPAPKPFTVSGVLSTIELNQDQQIRADAEDRKLAVADRLVLAEIRAAVISKAAPKA